MRNVLLIAGLLALGAVGCGEKKETASSGVSVEASQVTAASPEAPAAKPHGNKNTAVSDYSKLDSTLPLMMAYYNLTGLPPPFEEMASRISTDYANENDAFKKKDIFKVLKPKLQADMQALKTKPYLVLSDSVSLSPYDVNQKMFPVSGVVIDQDEVYFESPYGATTYAFELENRAELSKFKVTDENKAREIESMRSQQPNQKYEAEFYFYARDAKEGRYSYKMVHFEVMKIVVKKPDGTVFFEY